MTVGPCLEAQTTWWTSVTLRQPQPGNRQPLSRRRTSIRCASLGSRCSCFWSRLLPSGPSKDSVMSALHARRRATSAETGPTPWMEA